MENSKLYKISAYNSNLIYLFQDNSLFSQTEYRILNNQKDNNCFISCGKVMVNGQIELVYFTEDYLPLSAALRSLDNARCRSVLSDLINKVLLVKNNGFLSNQNIDISVERLFINPTTLRCRFIYVPSSKKLFSGQFAFEKELRSVMSKVIQSTALFPLNEANELCRAIMNEAVTLEEIRTLLNERSVSFSTEISRDVFPASDVSIRALDLPYEFILHVDKPFYCIGRKQDAVDGYIGFNKMIGRIHCRVEKTDEEVCLVDMNSANGTYINNVRLEPEKRYPVKDGDIVKLANSKFKIRIK